jgi:predicted kinase
MRLEIPDQCLVLLIGSTGAGKTTFARRHFGPTEVLSSDCFRAMVCDDENSLSATSDAFRCLRTVASARLKRRRLTVIDATSLRAEDRASLTELAVRHNRPAVAVVLDPGLEICLARNRKRTDRNSIPDQVLEDHDRRLRQSLGTLPDEGFEAVHVLAGEAAIESARFVRVGRRPRVRPAGSPGSVPPA